MSARKAIADSVLDIVGDTPLVRLSRLAPPGSAEILAKLEAVNPGGSVKDRIARRIVLDAETKGLLSPGATIVEATSGNTGIGLAMVAAVRGYRCVLTMPDDMSMERRLILEAYGAEIVLTPAEDGMAGAVERARAIAASTPGTYQPRQFENPSNPLAHRETTAVEIFEGCEGRIDAFVAGVGTGGTITGVGAMLREKLPNLLVIGVEPAASAVLSGGAPGPHGIQGIGAGFVPEVLDLDILSRVVAVTDPQSIDMAKRLARVEGLFVGVSSGAAVHAACNVAREIGPGKRVVVVLPDGGMKYLA